MCGCDDGACIPQREYRRKRTDPTPRDQLQEMIVFKVNGKCGYPLIDALRGCYTGLDGRDDRMFVGSKSSISMRLEVRPTSSVRLIRGLESAFAVVAVWKMVKSGRYCVSLFIAWILSTRIT